MIANARPPTRLAVLPATLPATLAVPSKAAILSALMSGQALPAGELAYRAGVTYQTTSFHLKQLLDHGYVRVRKIGRHRYYELADSGVAQILEKADLLTSSLRERRAPKGQTEAMRQARMCYDHLAGQLGVALFQALYAQKYLRRQSKNSEELAVTEAGRAFFARLKIDVDALEKSRRRFAFECVDWSERRPHLGGTLGCCLAHEFTQRHWIQRHKADRTLTVTPAGRRMFSKLFGVNVGAVLGARADALAVRKP